MYIQILGSAAGGGFPQWNCNCRNCHGLRSGSLKARPRTQSSIALSDDGVHWILCNASPDIRAQIDGFAPLQPARAVRDSGIAAVILLDSQIDHTTGLLSLREGCPHQVWCTQMVYQDLSSGFPLFNMLRHWPGGGLHWQPIDLTGSFIVPACPNLLFTPLPLDSAAPPYSPHRNDPRPGDNIGLLVRDLNTGGTLFYAPGLGRVDEALRARMASADCLLVDGTFWQDDEMIRCEVGSQLGSALGHLPQSGAGGMLAVLDGLPARKVLIHINNTNPILDENSAERAELSARGIEVAFDGMSIEL
ncbi:pyrroloquinoline quinone biosynthesis protein PqqB [Pseudomonas alcaligenes]|uniref:Coenzyme PQQ synthesis protein B n=1 Tax=Aquipseudomonas alcaligenes TaxID=43263 RepID=A0ABR7RX13_AQUAC|nr:pyrroloquinoline quinone biosynthesis protein PqqB [Pseudomonas alcaligenes]MBC9249882.1 pyrroloquinoline quinone biosynthesis protein PqqB [Pseudomonas alcaligenes]